jgi:hypothetical protein
MKATLSTLALAFVLAAGCSNPQQAEQEKGKRDLSMLGLMYHTYHDKYKAGPAKADDLKEVLSQDAKEAYDGLQSGKYVLIYGVKLVDVMKDGKTNDTVLGYSSGTPTSGGPVLMADASVRIVSADEFKKLPQAKGK